MEPVVVAIITSLPPTLVALAAWRKGVATSSAVGQSNGKGNITQMVEQLVDWTEAHDERHDALARSREDLIGMYQSELRSVRLGINQLRGRMSDLEGDGR